MQRINYDPEQWVAMAANKSAPCPSRAHIRLSKPGTIQVDLGSGWRNVAYGSEFKLSLPYAGLVKADVPFEVFAGIDVATSCEGVPLTNMDKRPGDSSVERMVKAALREKEVRDALARRQRLEADRALHAKRVQEGLQDDNPMPEPEPDPEPAEPSPDAAPSEPPSPSPEAA